MQLAQTEVERVRVLVAQGKNTLTDLPAITNVSTACSVPVTPPPTPGATPPPACDITSVPVPTILSTTLKSNNSNCSNLYSYGTQVPVNTVLQVDTDGNCQPDFLVQTFRDAGVVVPPTAPNPHVMVFHIGVRVYAAQAIQNGVLNLANPANCASLKFTNTLGSQQSLPLAALYSTIARSDSTYVSLEQYSNFVSPTPPTNPSSNCGF